MGGCAASRLGFSGEEEGPVALCRERKRLIRAAVNCRYELAAAHAAYIHSLNAVAAAIDIFVSRMSAPTPFLITLPDSSASASASAYAPPAISSPPCAYLRQTPTEPKIESLPCHASPPPASSKPTEAAESVEEEVEEEKKRGGETSCGYFLSTTGPMPPSPPPEVFGWDFFGPFDVVQRAAEPSVAARPLDRSSDEYLRAVREQEGIPDLEEADEYEEEEELKGETLAAERVPDYGGNPAAVAVANQEEELALSEKAGEGRDLLQALREIEDYFIKAYHSGKDVLRMLECNFIQRQPGHEETTENSSKVIRAITWHRSASFSSSQSHRSPVTSSSNGTSWAETTSELLDDYVGMESGSHSQTLARLYAWEKKLYEEVKAGDQVWQTYLKKCMQLRNQEAKGSKSSSVDKNRAIARDLHAGICVALRASQSISQRLEKLRDEELQPQIIELLQGMSRMWKTMLESHETQKHIMFEVSTFICPAYGKFTNNTHRLATVTLEAELRNWRSCFIGYVVAQKAYVEAIHGWLSKFLASDVECYSQTRSLFPSYRAGTPPLVIMCHEWLASLRKLPDQPVSSGMRSFIRTVQGLWIKQGEEQQQKRKVDRLTKELDRRVHALQKEESKVVEFRLSENELDSDLRQRVECLSAKKELLDLFRKKLEAEKAKHRDCLRKTHEITINGFKIGLASIFESLMQFSKDSVSLYDLLMHEKGKVVHEMAEKTTFIETLGHG